jgi:hypothetical protein
MGRLRLRLRLRLREKKSEVGGLRLKKGLEANGKVEVKVKVEEEQVLRFAPGAG